MSQTTGTQTAETVQTLFRREQAAVETYQKALTETMELPKPAGGGLRYLR